MSNHEVPKYLEIVDEVLSQGVASLELRVRKLEAQFERLNANAETELAQGGGGLETRLGSLQKALAHLRMLRSVLLDYDQAVCALRLTFEGVNEDFGKCRLKAEDALNALERSGLLPET